MIVAVTGIRDLAPTSFLALRSVLLEESERATEWRLGGALGADTEALMALLALGQATRCTIFVPYNVDAQPAVARDAIIHAKDRGARVIELHLPESKSGEAFLRRNDAMVNGANRLVAFTDGRSYGGTAYTIRRAEKLGIPVRKVTVNSERKERRAYCTGCGAGRTRGDHAAECPKAYA